MSTNEHDFSIFLRTARKFIEQENKKYCKKYLYAKLEEVNKARAIPSINNTQLFWLNGQRAILLNMLQDFENDNGSN